MRYTLYSCHRPVMHPDKRGGELPVEHCYAKLVDEQGQMVDAISYDGLNGISENQATKQTSSSCERVTNISKEQWQDLKQNVHDNCRSDNFSLKSNNCCSCLEQAFNTEIGAQPQNIREAQAQIQTQEPHVIIES